LLNLAWMAIQLACWDFQIFPFIDCIMIVRCNIILAEKFRETCCDRLTRHPTVRIVITTH